MATHYSWGQYAWTVCGGVRLEIPHPPRFAAPSPGGRGIDLRPDEGFSGTLYFTPLDFTGRSLLINAAIASISFFERFKFGMSKSSVVFPTVPAGSARNLFRNTAGYFLPVSSGPADRRFFPSTSLLT